MIEQKILRVKKDITLPCGINLKQNDEIEIVDDCIYMHGYPIPLELQAVVYHWIEQNLGAFREDFRRFK